MGCTPHFRHPGSAAMTRPAPSDPAFRNSPSRGRCFVYVAPCTCEDLLKVGHSRDPLGRLQALHRRWYEFFDSGQAWLVELDHVREAASLESSLRRGLAEHNAPAPLTIRREAAGHGEWFRGAQALLEGECARLAGAGHLVHVPARDWLRAALLARADRLHAWTSAMLDVDALDGPVDATPVTRAVRDALDAYAAFDIDVAPLLPPGVARWRGLPG